MAIDPLMRWEWEGGAVLNEDDPDVDAAGATDESNRDEHIAGPRPSPASCEPLPRHEQ
jgi:hypothetical protein